MTTITFDTHAAVESLIKKGINKEQAEGIVKIIQECKEIDINSLATKSDLKVAVAELKADMLKWFIANTFIIVGIMISGFAMLFNVLK